MRISDWSSDVCSSDLESAVGQAILRPPGVRSPAELRGGGAAAGLPGQASHRAGVRLLSAPAGIEAPADRKSVVWGKSVSVRVDLGGRRIHKKKKKTDYTSEKHIRKHNQPIKYK